MTAADGPAGIALFLPHTVEPPEAIAHARAAEAAGFGAVMLADSLRREVTTSIAAIAASTTRIQVGSAVAPIWTRNPAAFAATAATLDAIAPGRVVLGLGAWWEPIATKVGVDRRGALTAMRETVEAVRALLGGGLVTISGQHVRLDEVQLDDVSMAARSVSVPLLIGATGPKMLELAGAVADGVVMNYLISPAATADATAIVERGRSAAAPDRPFTRWQLIACSVGEDRAAALDAARPLVARALAQQPHIMRASGVDPQLIEHVAAAIPWPATDDAVAEIAHVVPDAVVELLTASGTVADCRQAIERYRDAGCERPILFPLDERSIPTLIDAFR
jgi:5,10-methylenetetrahydromethanopterin reductase